jgi:hypothetical protein
MSKDYETIMTLGLGVSTNLTNQLDPDEYTSSLPRPEGKGWHLMQVVPVHNNHRYLQFFWERESLIGSAEDPIHYEGVSIKQSNIRLHIPK